MTSVAERIASNIVSTIAALPAFAAPTAGGCRRSSSDGDEFSKLPSAFVFAREESKSKSPYPAYTCTLTFEIHVADAPSSAGATDWETYIDGHLRSIEKALMADPERGIGADSGVDTDLQRSIKYLALSDGEDKTIEGICAALIVDVTYRHKFDDPEVVI